MRAEQLAINSQCTSNRNLEEALEAQAAAGYRHAEPHLNLVKDWLDDGVSVEQTRELFEAYDLRVVASSQLELACFGSPDARLPNLRANAENARLVQDLGGDKLIVGTDGPEQVSVEALDAIAFALSDLDADAVRWIKHVHVNDMPDKPADLTHRDSDRVLPGEGVLDLREIIGTLEQGGYDGFFSLEMFDANLWRLPAKEAARRCYESLLPLCD